MGTLVSSSRDYLQRLAGIEAAIAAAQLDADAMVQRAAGFIAGRVGCRIDEALAHLHLLAKEQRRDTAAVASDVLTIMYHRIRTPGTDVRTAVEDALRATPSAPAELLTPPHRPAPPAAEHTDWAAVVQQVLRAMPGNHTVVAPVRDADGQIVDFVVVAVSDAVVDLSGRRGKQLVGRPISDMYPIVVDGPVWQAWKDVLADGMPREVGPMPYHGGPGGQNSPITIQVQVHAVGPGLLSSWIRPDEQARLSERIAQTERLGNLGWGEWDLVSGKVVWSEEMFRIYERDPAEGPLRDEESRALQLPEDEPLHRQAAASFGRGETVDVTYRARIGGRIKHLRTVIDAVRDTTGRPIKVYGIVQDVTARETTRAKLAEIERQLRSQQETLAAEHQLAAQLQQIILPVPPTPIDLPGLQAAVRYQPAEEASRVGGDWYHADALDDGDVLIAVGDVAGHGIRAATTMARLRHALAALSIISTADPAELLSHLNRLLRMDGSVLDTATAVIARFRPADRTLVWAQAGHPPPLLTRDGRTEILDRPRGPLLGAVRQPRYEMTTTRLRDSDLLVLYTDGLIEHRRRTTAQGFAPVIRTLDEASRREPLTALLSRLHRANARDDTCVLAAQPVPGTAASPPVTGPSSPHRGHPS